MTLRYDRGDIRPKTLLLVNTKCRLWVNNCSTTFTLKCWRRYTSVFILHLSVPLWCVELSHDWSFAVSINSTSTANVRSIIHLPKILTKPTKESVLWPPALTISNQNNGMFKMFNVLSPLIHKDRQPSVLTYREKWRIKRFPHPRNKYSFGSPVGSKCLRNPNVE